MKYDRREIAVTVDRILANELKKWKPLPFEEWLVKRPTLSDPIRYGVSESGIDYAVEVALLELETNYVHAVVDVMTVLNRPRWMLFFPSIIHKSEDWIVNRMND